LIQICESDDIEILKGVVSGDHVHLHFDYCPNQSVSEIERRLKGRSSRKLQQESPELNKRYLGSYFFGIVYGCWSSGNITSEMVNEYLEHNRENVDNNTTDFILE
jgi:putative transposase